MNYWKALSLSRTMRVCVEQTWQVCHRHAAPPCCSRKRGSPYIPTRGARGRTGGRGNHRRAGEDDPNAAPPGEGTDDSPGETSPCHRRCFFQLFSPPKQTNLCKLINPPSFYSPGNPTPAAPRDPSPRRSCGRCTPWRAGARIAT